MITRKIPATMVTQHPDNASKPYWHNKTFISSQFETEEAYLSFVQLGATEYKWDWEGKLVDESVVDRLLSTHFDYFIKNPLGEKKFLTFRLPNPRIETEFRMGRAFINMASSASVAKHFGFKVPPIFEVILPMTVSAVEMFELQEAYSQIHLLKHPLFKLDGFLTRLYVIPLFESVPIIINSDRILKNYLRLYKKKFKTRPHYLRPYVARSDPALNSGIIPTVLAIKIALSRYKKLSTKEGIPFYPIIGAGTLPFRGSLNPERIDDFINEYKGIKTTTIQSAFRYDFSKNQVTKAIKKLEKNLPKNSPQTIANKEEKILLSLITEGERQYKQIIEPIAPVINQIAHFVPRRRERFLHVGLFGYSRGEKGIKLPRAISFTASLYSLGVPPEFIGTGRLIKYAMKKNVLKLLEKYYINIKKDLIIAGKYLNKKNLSELAQTSSAWQSILEEINIVEDYLKMSFSPKTKKEKEHYKITERILALLKKRKKLNVLIEKATILRKSLG